MASEGMNSHQTERIGVAAVQLIFVSELEWIFREQFVSDYGIDAIVEIIEDGAPTGKLIAVQIKSGISFFKESKGFYKYTGEKRHLEYWLNHSLPVFLVLHNPVTNVTVWQKIEKRLVDIKENTWSISIPKDNILDKFAAPFLSAGVSSDEEARRRLYFHIDKIFMKEIKDRVTFFVIDEWVNKSLGIRGIKVYFDDYRKSKPDREISLYAPTHDIYDFMVTIYPWLEYEYAEEIEDHDAEVATHIMEVKLSDIAKSYLAVESFWEHGWPIYSDPMASSHHDEMTEEEYEAWQMDRALSRDKF